MKASRITLIAQIVLMYIMDSPLYAIMILMTTHLDDNLMSELIKGLLIAFLVLSILIFPICMANAALSLISIFKGQYNPSKIVMICKLVLIPWYILNFIMCIMLIGGMLNPFMMIAIPIVICIEVIITYVYMISTSLPDIAYFFNRVFRKAISVNGLLIVSIVLLFIFCLDIVGGIMFYLSSAKNQKRELLQ